MYSGAIETFDREIAGSWRAMTPQMDERARRGRYPSGLFVPAVSRAFAAFEWQEFSAAIEPIAAELECIGGSHAQLDLVRFTLSKAYLNAGRLDDTRRLLNLRAPQWFPLPGRQRAPASGESRERLTARSVRRRCGR